MPSLDSANSTHARFVLPSDVNDPQIPAGVLLRAESLIINLCYVQAGVHRKHVRGYHNERTYTPPTITSTHAWFGKYNDKRDHPKSAFCYNQDTEETLLQVCFKA